ncbi:methyltransferase [Afipia carboxidovorans OM5]|nr:methyltransferase [Afipia carboxidovorans OM5]
MRATGLEVRTSNVKKCFYLKSKLGLPNLNFVQDDCWNFKQYGNSFDVIFCSGLLYHLSEPRKFIGMLADSCNHLILDTHYATVENDHETLKLDEVATHEGLSGRWYREYEDGKDNRNDNAHWNSWGNTRSFWPYKDEVLRALESAGFKGINDSYFPRHDFQRFMVTGHK